jgi:hypothetical protein
VVATTKTSSPAGGHVNVPAFVLALGAHAHAHVPAPFILAAAFTLLLYLAMLALTILSYLPKE